MNGSNDVAREARVWEGRRAAGAVAVLGRVAPVLLLAGLALPILYRNIGRVSPAAAGDTQGLLLALDLAGTERLVPPAYRGEPLYEVPPFKALMAGWTWRRLGRTLLALRIWDPAFAAATVLVVYASGARLIGSRLAGLASGLFLLGSRPFVFEHGARGAFQEASLVLLATLSLCLYGTRPPGRSPARARMALAGLACGLAGLAKQVAGLFPLVVADLDQILARKPERARLRDLGLLHGLAFLPSVAWFCLLWTNDPSSLRAALGLPVIAPAATASTGLPLPSLGFHLRALWEALHPWGWLVLALPFVRAELSALARETRFLFVWMAVVLVGISASGDRHPWSIYSALPGACLLLGLFFRAALSRLGGARRLGRARWVLASAAFAAWAAAAGLTLAAQWGRAAQVGERGSFGELADWLASRAGARPRLLLAAGSCEGFASDGDCVELHTMGVRAEFLADPADVEMALEAGRPALLVIEDERFSRWVDAGHRSICDHGATLKPRAGAAGGEARLVPRTVLAYGLEASGWSWRPRGRRPMYPCPPRDRTGEP